MNGSRVVLLDIFDRLVEEPDLFAIRYCQCVYFVGDNDGDRANCQNFSQIQTLGFVSKFAVTLNHVCCLVVTNVSESDTPTLQNIPKAG